jgi:formiminotetrahydrofolate cyclodeaminase
MDFSARTIEGFVDDLAAKTPTPGGGAVVGLVGALAAALGRMVVNYSLGKKKLAEHQPELQEKLERLEHATRLFLDLADQDAEAYEALSAAMKISKDDPARAERLPVALVAAIRAPQASLAAAVETLEMLDELTGKTNRFLVSDFAIAGMLAEAAAKAAAWNVEINVPMLEDEADRERVRGETRPLLERAHELAARLDGACGVG